MPMNKKSDVRPMPEDGRSRILAAAHRIFSAYGYDSASVALILGEAGLKAPALYHHFGDKEGLYRVWVERLTEAVCEQLRELPQNTSVEQQIKDFAFVLVRSNVDLLQIRRDLAFMKRDETVEAIEHALQEEVYDPLEELFSRLGVADGEVKRTARYFTHTLAFASRTYDSADLDEEKAMEWVVARFVYRMKGQGNRPIAASE